MLLFRDILHYIKQLLSTCETSRESDRFPVAKCFASRFDCLPLWYFETWKQGNYRKFLIGNRFLVTLRIVSLRM